VRLRAGVAVALAAVMIVGAGGVAVGSSLMRSAPRSERRGDPWARYQTAVLPGSGPQFAFRRVGYALSAAPSNGFDGNLSSPDGLDLYWPSPTVLVTHDGGRRWQRSLTVRGGFWDVDAVDRDYAWAVGVTGLFRTQDGGLRWQRVTEPRQPLVRVAFIGSRRGFGLTLDGALVETSDAGRSWTKGSLRARGDALCAQQRETVLVATPSGAIWRSVDGGRRFARTAAGFAHLRYFSAWFSDLECTGARATELTQALCGALETECGTEQRSYVRQTDDRGRRWAVVFAQRAAGSDGGGVHSSPPAALRLPLERAAPAGAGACLVGYSFNAPAELQVSCSGKARGGWRSAVTPRLPLPVGNTTVEVQGIDFHGADDGWMMVDEYSVTGRGGPSGTRARTEIWATWDAGRLWHPIYRTRAYSWRYCSALGGICWRSPFS